MSRSGRAITSPMRRREERPWRHGRRSARELANWAGVKRDFAALFAVPIGFLVMIGVSLFTPAPSRDVQSFVEDLRKPQVA